MDKADFLAALRQTPRDWRLKYGPLGNGTAIRMGGCCPLQWLAKEQGHHLSGVYACGEVLELSVSDVEAIVTAADFAEPTNFRTAALRKELLDACGLKEQNDG